MGLRSPLLLGNVSYLLLTDELKAILADPACAEWMPVNVKHGAAPAFGDDGLCFRFEDDAEAERFPSGLSISFTER